MRPPASGARLPGWPDPVFDDLLRAAAGPSVTAPDAWRRFHRAFDLDRVDGDSYRLLASVAGNLDATVHPDHPDRARIAGIARRTWFANQRAYANLARVVEGLGERGIEVLVAKGGALAVQAFPGVAHRPFSDIDIYVRPDRRRDATDWFLREDYEPSGWIRDLDGRHAVGFVRGDLGGGDVFDLHALPPDGLRLRRHPERSADVLWEGSVPLVHGLVATRALGPAEQLVLVLVHGLDVRSESPLRGFADAAWIIRTTGGTLDWVRVLAFANARRVHLEVRVGLRYVHEVIGVEVPAAVLARPGHWAATTPRDRALLWARTGAPPRHRQGPAGSAQRWLLRTEAEPLGGAAADLVGFPRRVLEAQRRSGARDRWYLPRVPTRWGRSSGS
jgi:hypothetical protein